MHLWSIRTISPIEPVSLPQDQKICAFIKGITGLYQRYLDEFLYVAGPMVDRIQPDVPHSAYVVNIAKLSILNRYQASRDNVACNFNGYQPMILSSPLGTVLNSRAQGEGH